MEQYTLEHLLDLFDGYKLTRPINDLYDGCVSFIRDKSVLFNPKNAFNCWILVPKGYGLSSSSGSFKFLSIDNPEYHFTLYHNYINRFRMRNKRPIVNNTCVIHETAVLGVEGLKVIIDPITKQKIQFRHIGEIVLGNDVEIGALSVVHRGTLSDTIIGNNTKIGAKCNIAHNNVIGDGCVFAVGVLTSGSVKIGNNCWFGTGSIISNGVTICDDVVVGAGAVVVKNITKSGIYVGNPARYLKPMPEGFNF